MAPLNDLYQTVLFNNGEQVVEGDQNDEQRFMRAVLSDQIIAKILDGFGTDPQFTGQGGVNPSLIYGFCLHGGSANFIQGASNAAVRIAAGTLFQRIAAVTGLDAQFVPFTFDGTSASDQVFANGSVGNPRVDIIEMQLAYANDPTVNRTFNTVAVAASLNLATVTAHDNTVVAAKNPGLAGNNISVQFIKNTGAGVVYTESGYAVQIKYQDGVSTVDQVEAAIIANSTVLVIQSTGTAGVVLHDPADTFAATHLTGGADQNIATQTMSKKRRVQCTLQIKQGVAAASPVIPTPDAGFVAIAAMVIPASYAWGTAWGIKDSATVPCLYDLRMPLGSIKAHHVPPGDFHFTSNWTADNYKTIITAGATPDNVYIPLRRGGLQARVVGVTLDNKVPNAGTINPFLAEFNRSNSGINVTALNALGVRATPNGVEDLRQDILQQTADTPNPNAGSFEFNHNPAAGPTVQANGNGQGPPVWTSGMRAPYQKLATEAINTRSFDTVCMLISGAAQNQILGPATFFVAEGL